MSNNILWKVIIAIAIVVVGYTALTNWQGLKTNTIQSIFDGGKKVTSSVVDGVGDLTGGDDQPTTTTTTQPPGVFGKPNCQSNEQCQESFPTCQNCECRDDGYCIEG